MPELQRIPGTQGQYAYELPNGNYAIVSRRSADILRRDPSATVPILGTMRRGAELAPVETGRSTRYRDFLSTERNEMHKQNTFRFYSILGYYGTRALDTLLRTFPPSTDAYGMFIIVRWTDSSGNPREARTRTLGTNDAATLLTDAEDLLAKYEIEEIDALELGLAFLNT